MEQSALEFERKIQEIKTKIAGLQEKLEPYKEAAQKAKEDSDRNSAELEKLTATMETNTMDLDRLQRHIHELNNLHAKYSKKLDDADRACQRAKPECEELEEELNESIANLKKGKIRPREDFDEHLGSSSTIDKRISQLEVVLREQLKAGGRNSVDDVLRELTEAKRKYKGVSTQYKELEEFSKHVRSQLKARHASWKKLRKLTAKLVQHKFTSFLSQKGYKGNLQFSDRDETLGITIELEQLRSAKTSHAQSVNSLSGGERSFSTVSLLMALWSVMETPFTAMDEFDVFMDQISRMKSTEMLLSFARGCTTRQQFIFITPQSLQNVEPAPDLHIVRMRPPRP